MMAKYLDKRLSHSELLKGDVIDNVSFNLKRMEWIADNNLYAWTEYIVEMYIRDLKLVSVFTFQDRDKANQLYILMVEGKK